MSLPDAPLAGDNEAAPAVVATCARELLTPLGLRSLSPGDPAYEPYHRGGPAERDAAYHQGTVWPWLVGPYVDAARNIGLSVDDLLDGLEAHLGDWGLGSISETADGAPPHAATGCPFQAWSVAEVLRVRRGLVAAPTVPARTAAGRKQPRGGDTMTNSSENGRTNPRVLILGGGFAGIGAARNLKDADVDVVLVDKHDYHTFQPLLYQLATGLLEQTAVGHSLRDLLHGQDNATVHQDVVTGIDLAARQVRFEQLAPLTYDFLVLGIGAEVNFFGTKGAADHAFPMYTLADAVRLKDHLLERWEAADRDPSLVEDGALNAVVVGGGPTGVETAGALAELYRADFAKDYRIEPEQARIVLVEAGPDIFSMFKPNLRKYAKEALEKRTVELMTGVAVESVSPTRVTLKTGEVLNAHTLVWGAGLQGNRLVQSLGLQLERGNRIGVGPELNIPDHPEVYAIGDVAAITDQKTGQVLPQLGSVALQSGEHAGETIARVVANKKTKPFSYRDKGTMATIGRGAAVVQMLGGKTMKGLKAQVAWGTVHLALLPTNEDRAKAVVDWAGAALTHQRAGRITVETDEREPG